MECPVCGQEMSLEEKDTSSGHDMRTYRCPKCGRPEDADYGVALWQVLSDAREAGERRSPSEDDKANGGAWRGKARWLPRFVRALCRSRRNRS
jgi:hypothetical protein